jgi:Cupin
MRLLNDASNDEVTELLASLKVHSSVYCLSDLGAPWGFVVDGADTAKFHLVLEGVSLARPASRVLCDLASQHS